MSRLRARTLRVGAALQSLGGQFAEPAFDEVEPGTAYRGEVRDEARMRGQPPFDRRGLHPGESVRSGTGGGGRRPLLAGGTRRLDKRRIAPGHRGAGKRINLLGAQQRYAYNRPTLSRI